jgi:hypothetical protein
VSADAKVWCDDEHGVIWRGVHDGVCTTEHKDTLNSLAEAVKGIETCMNAGRQMRWKIRAYANGEFGLVGYV